MRCLIADCSGACRSNKHTAYYHANPEKFRRKSNAWRAKNVEKGRNSSKAYSQTPKGRYAALKAKAKRRKLACDITFSQFVALVESKNCTYCHGTLPVSGHGLDRVDNSRGYTLDNVVACCAHCNKIRNDILTHEEMKAAMGAVLEMRQYSK